MKHSKFVRSLNILLDKRKKNLFISIAIAMIGHFLPTFYQMLKKIDVFFLWKYGSYYRFRHIAHRFKNFGGFLDITTNK